MEYEVLVFSLAFYFFQPLLAYFVYVSPNSTWVKHLISFISFIGFGYACTNRVRGFTTVNKRAISFKLIPSVSPFMPKPFS